jgi:hypothetical protein
MGFSIWSGPDGGLPDGILTEDDDGSGKVPVLLTSFPLSGLPGVSYVLEKVVKLIPLNI